MKQGTVAPRTIQFNETIQIREIEANEEPQPEESNRRGSWDPNLAKKDFFKPKPTKQRNVIIAITIVGLLLLGVVIGTVVGVVMSQKSTTAADNSVSYNQACQSGSKQCISSQGLSCPNGFCACSSPLSWNSATTSCTLLSYNQVCSSSAQCNSTLGLSCVSQACRCDSYHRWDSTTSSCVMILNNTLTFGTSCTLGSAQCNGTIGLTCSGTCNCTQTKVWNNVSQCVCPSGTFLNTSNLCETLHALNESCTNVGNECDPAKDLFCNNTRCLCDFSQRYWNRNYEMCLPRLNYSQSCTYDDDCLPTLICPTVPGVCNCSRYLPDYTCNCANTKYYDSNLTQCVNRASFNGTCLSLANYTCLTPLYCNSGRCACPVGTTWISSNGTCL